MSWSEHSVLSWSMFEAAKEASRRSKLKKREKASNFEAMEMVKRIERGRWDDGVAPFTLNLKVKKGEAWWKQMGRQLLMLHCPFDQGTETRNQSHEIAVGSEQRAGTS